MERKAMEMKAMEISRACRETTTTRKWNCDSVWVKETGVNRGEGNRFKGGLRKLG